MYTSQALENTEDILGLEAEWEKLHSSSLTQTVFQTPSFQQTWWDTLGFGKRIIITIRDKEMNLVALAPIFLEETENEIKLNLVGCVNVSDYLDVLIDNTEENIDAIYESLLSEIDKINWDKLFWCSLPEKSKTRDALKRYFSENENVKESIQDVAPIINLPESWDEYLVSVGRKQRHEIRRKQRKLDQVNHAYEVIQQPTVDDVDDFIALHKQSSQNKKEFWDEKHLIFFRKLVPTLAVNNKIRMFFLRVDNKRVASMLAFDEPDSLALYNSGFSAGTYDELSIGSNLIAYTIKYAIENRKGIYDFLRGDEAYKFRFGAISTNVYDIEIDR